VGSASRLPLRGVDEFIKLASRQVDPALSFRERLDGFLWFLCSARGDCTSHERGNESVEVVPFLLIEFRAELAVDAQLGSSGQALYERLTRLSLLTRVALVARRAELPCGEGCGGIDLSDSA
jgi:hypothetical protein